MNFQFNLNTKWFFSKTSNALIEFVLFYDLNVHITSSKSRTNTLFCKVCSICFLLKGEEVFSSFPSLTIPLLVLTTMYHFSPIITVKGPKLSYGKLFENFNAGKYRSQLRITVNCNNHSCTKSFIVKIDI